MQFTYKAVSADGKLLRGRLSAINTVDLEIRLKRLGLELVSGTPAREEMSFLEKGVPRQELINFCFHLEQLLKAGVPILEGLADLRDSVEHPAFREVIAGLVESIEGGNTLSQALDCYPKIFGKVFINLVRAGELSGKLADMLGNLTESLKWQDEIAAQTKALLIYPAFVSFFVLATTVFLMVYVVPQLKSFIKNMGQDLPAHTKLLFMVSDFLVQYWHILLVVPIIALAVFHWVLRTNPHARESLESLKLRLPIVGAILKKVVLSRFAHTFSILYAAGIPILESIGITQQVVGNREVQRALQRTEQAIRDGRNITAAFSDVNIFPPLVIRMLRIGENTGELDKALLNVSYFYTRNVKESVSKAQTLIEPILTVAMGLILGWIMLSVIGPIYDTISKIKT